MSITKSGYTPTKVGNTYLFDTSQLSQNRADREALNAIYTSNDPWNPDKYDYIYQMGRDGSTSAKANNLFGAAFAFGNAGLTSLYEYAAEQIADGNPLDDIVAKPKPAPYSPSGGLPQSAVDYIYADLAKHYGMSAESAYQEALSNTSYARAVKDMKNAGLNPAVIFGSGRASGSDGVSYISARHSGAGGSAKGVSSKADSGFLSDKNFMQALGTLAFVVSGKSASTGGNVGKAVASIFEKLTK